MPSFPVFWLGGVIWAQWGTQKILEDNAAALSFFSQGGLQRRFVSSICLL